jgi:hypothetical protein
MTDESLPGAACPLIVCPFQRVMEPRSRRQRSRAAARAPTFFATRRARSRTQPTRTPREDDRGRGNAEIVDAACAWRPRHYFVGLLKAGQIDQGLLRLAISHLVEASVEGRQPRPLTHPAPASRHSALLVRPARHIRVHPLGSRSKQPRAGQTTHNGLVGVSSPPGPTTQSCATGDFL